MAGKSGQIKVDYEGRVPEGLWGQIRKAGKVSVLSIRPLTLITTGKPDNTLAQIWRYLTDAAMRVQRVEVRARA